MLKTSIMTNPEFKKGTILEGTIKGKEAARHYVVFYKGDPDVEDFSGGFITHSPKYGNIPMTDSHFEKGYAVGYDNSHLANGLYIKLKDWKPYKRVGQLTVEGIEFLEKKIGHLEPKLYTNYMDEIEKL